MVMAACKWWVPSISRDGDGRRLGECRRFPPVPAQTSRGLDDVSPQTPETYWCGEYAPRADGDPVLPMYDPRA